MNKHRKDSDALLEAFQQIQLGEAKKKPDEDGDGVPDWADKKSGKDDHDQDKKSGKKEMSTKQKKYFGEEAHKTTYGGKPVETEDDEEDAVEEMVEGSHEIGEDRIQDALRNLSGSEQDDGDWELAIKDIMGGLAERMIYHANRGDGGVTQDMELAQRWDVKVAIMDAVKDLLAGHEEDLKKSFQVAFMRAKKDEEDGRFNFDSDSGKLRGPGDHYDPKADTGGWTPLRPDEPGDVMMRNHYGL